jgi:allantoate deiminase
MIPSDRITTRVLERIEHLATFSEEPDALTRPFLSNAMLSACEQLRQWMQAAGMQVRRDTVGNIIGHYPASDRKAPILLLGSHIDSVRNAGKYDGPLGIIVALCCIESLHEEGRRLPFAIELVAFADEEGLRYNSTYLGSKALAGRFEQTLLDRVDSDGISVADAIRKAGGNPNKIAKDALDPKKLLGYCEIHIEQGPVLEELDQPLGVVSSIAGQSRILVTFTGLAGHAGTVPMKLRHDALCAAASFITSVESLGLQHEGAVATVGQLIVGPNASNVIPGHVRLSVDVRHQDDSIRNHICSQLQHIARTISDERGIDVAWDLVQENPAVNCDPRLQQLWGQAIADNGFVPHNLVSGAGHDGVIMSQITPISMLFVRCAGGISHNPAESVRSDDIGAACLSLCRFLELLAQKQSFSYT